uniref:Site-specific DNA-methyltransferase n=1 Tax=Thermorudis sp. TaxID=1969470 RepID=A0A7C2ZYA7_9BACT
MTDTWRNQLYFGDNLDVLREHIPDASVDLIYLDPPFNSNATYNVLFRERSGEQSAAQITAFEDTWHWGIEAERTFHELVTAGPKKVADLMQALRAFLGQNDVMAYLTMMAIRLVELHRVLKPTGSLYLHCDPTASHYIKLVLDAIFGPRQFKNEIIWKRSSAHSDTKQGMRRYGRVHDVILFYTKTETYTWNSQYLPYDEKYVQEFYRYVEPETGRRYRMDNLTAAKPGGDTQYAWRVKRRIDPPGPWQADLDDEWQNPQPGWEYKAVYPYRGRFWAYSKENMIAFERAGRLVYTKTGMPCYKRYLDEQPGVPLQDIWDDIPPALGKEDLGYPTQKPQALLERIINASSNPGDLVLDPFCGCGTAVVAAEKLGRRWIGIDITYLAIDLIERRLQDTFGDELHPYEVHGAPKDLPSARALAQRDRHQFEWWALSLVDAHPAQDKRKGADRGIDGFIYFFDDDSGQAKRIVVQVKSGAVNVGQVRDLRGVIDREQAAIGVLITLEPPTEPMKREAVAAGFYEPPRFPGRRYPRLQILTVQELLSGARVQYPQLAPVATFKRAKRERKKQLRQERLAL